MLKFVTFEGGEGSGKSTIVGLVSEKLSEIFPELPILKTREPGGTETAEQVRSVIMTHDTDAITEAYLFAAARAAHLREKVIPFLKTGGLVLCDRYIDSNLVYQGIVRGIPCEKIFRINEEAIIEDDMRVMPGITFFLDVKPEVGLARINKAGRTTNRFDNKEIEFHHQVYDGYKKLTEMYPERFVVVDANRKPDEIVRDVVALITEKIGL